MLNRGIAGLIKDDLKRKMVFISGPRQARTFRKESKVYFWDWSEITQKGPGYENFVGSHLLKLCQWLSDVEGYRMDLRFVRDREKREVDFLVLKENEPWVLVEAKVTGDKDPGTLYYFKQRLPLAVARIFSAYLDTEKSQREFLNRFLELWGNSIQS